MERNKIDHELVKNAFMHQKNKIFLLDQVVRKFGYNTAAFIGHLLHRYFLEKIHSEWLAVSISEIEDQIYLTKHEQDSCIRALSAAQILQSKRAGLPAKRHFNLNMALLAELLSDNTNFKHREE